jgi:O-antigen ligase
MPVDFRMGLAVFVLLELGAWLTLAYVKEPWFRHPSFAAWRNGFFGATAVILAGVVVLWLAGSRSRRFGWIILLAVIWLLVLAVRLVPLFMLGGASVPALLTIFVGQLTFGLMVPAAANERRRAARRTS